MNNIEQIINEWDPIELIAFCPKDEYKPEIDEIQALSNDVSDVDKMANIIFNTFIKYFDDEFKRDFSECERIAERILNERA